MAGRARYTLIRKIADGGMAEIFLASQRGAEGFEKTVVLKRILPALSADPQFRNMLLDEAHIAMTLSHSSIVQVLDLGEAGDRYFLALEFVDGWNLNQLFQRAAAVQMGFPNELAFYVTAEVCRALAYAHAKTRDGKPLGIVHRDVSPHNVLISEQGEVKLADFGIAKATDRRERSVSGAIKGKISYMSPEQAKGIALDHRSDLFSLGTMLYLMIVGRSAFEAPTDLETFYKVQAGEFDPPEVARPGMDPAVARVIAQAMKKDPADRYQSAEDMLVDVEQVLRTALKPAGQTELKRWLAALAAKDGGVPVGRTKPGETPAPPASAGALYLADSPSLSLELMPMWAESTQAALSEPGLRDAVTRADRSGEGSLRTLTSGIVEVKEPRRRIGAGTVLVVLLALIGAGVAAAYFRILPGWDEEAGAGGGKGKTVGRVETGAAADAAHPDDHDGTAAAATASAAPDTAKVAVTAAPPLTAAPTAAPATAVAVTAAPASAAGEDDGEEASEETERSLLREAVADVARAVLGEDEGEPDTEPAATARPTAAPATATATPKGPAPVTALAPPRPTPAADRVSVKIISVPAGAIVRSKTKVWGRTPITLQFKPGITYDLGFVKSGYYSTHKSFYATTKKLQTLKVYMAKAGKKKHR